MYALYQRRLYAANAMDFDDMILQTVLLLEADAEARAAWQERFSHIMVDEYQDTNHAQFRLLSMPWPSSTRNIAVVGDPDQSIYAFRGADIRNIAEFEHDFPGARVVALEQNYRSTQAILDAANAVIARNPDRRPEAALVGSRPRPAGAGGRGRRRARRGPLRGRRDQPRRSTRAPGRPTSPSSTA